MIYLLDTNVLSERTKRNPSEKVIAFLRRVPASDARIPAIVLGEIKQGVQSNPIPELIEFLNDILALPVAPFDELEALAWGEMTAEALSRGRTVYVRDSLIAATARANRWVVATRNVSDFTGLGVDIFNPFEDEL